MSIPLKVHETHWSNVPEHWNLYDKVYDDLVSKDWAVGDHLQWPHSSDLLRGDTPPKYTPLLVQKVVFMDYELGFDVDEHVPPGDLREAVCDFVKDRFEEANYEEDPLHRLEYLGAVWRTLPTCYLKVLWPHSLQSYWLTQHKGRYSSGNSHWEYTLFGETPSPGISCNFGAFGLKAPPRPNLPEGYWWQNHVYREERR